MRCPSCGARNADDAAWCTQCFAPLDEPPQPEPRATAPAAPPTPAGGSAADRPFRTRDEEVEWRCRRCQAWNPLGVPSCATCGLPLVDEPYRTPERIARTRRTLWIVAAVVCVTVVIVLVLALVTLQGA